MRIKYILWILCGSLLLSGFGLLATWAGSSASHDSLPAGWTRGAVVPAVGALLLALAAVTFFLIQRISIRLGQLADMAQRLIRESPGHRIPVSGNDEISSITGSLNDISEYLAVTYRELHDAAESYRDLSSRLADGDAIKGAMLSTALDAIVTIDEDGMVHDFNVAAEKLFGYTREEVLGREMAELIVPKAYREAHRRGMLHWRATGEANVFGTRIEIEAQNKQGEIFPIELAITPLGLDNDVYFTGFIRDITEKKKAEAELRLAASAFDSREGIFITDADSRIIRANQAILDMSGMAADDILGQAPNHLFASAEVSPAEGANAWGEILASDQRQGDIYIRPREGTAIPCWTSISTVCNDEGAVTHYVAHVMDMTERKRFEQALESARAEAEGANRAKSQFLANMSHEIRTPLNAIINLNSLLLNSALKPGQQELASAANKGGKALSTLVDDILDFSKIEAGKLRLMKHPFNLHKLIADLDALFRPQALSDGLEFGTSVAEDVTEWVNADETRLRQVLVNLLGNALKFTETGRVEMTVERAGSGMTAFRVRDTGIGVSPKDADLIFSEFSQADGSLTRRHGGTGLGLSISERIVKMMKSQIHYTPAPEAGSIFWFEVALEMAEQPEQVETVSEGQLLVGARILVAEDSHANQMVAEALLRKAGCRVTLVSNGQEAVDAVSEGKYDAVLMDLSMPVMDGLQATRRIRDLEGPGSGVPVVAMTANVFAEDRARCLQAGMNDFVPKPIQEQSLIDRLVHWLDPKRSQAPSEEVAMGEIDTFELMDESILDRMEQETSADLMKEVIGIFLEETRDHLGLLREAGPDVEPKVLIAEAHAIKSSAGTFGAARLHDVARRVEALARKGRHEHAVSTTNGLFAVGAQTIEQYEARFLSDAGHAAAGESGR